MPPVDAFDDPALTAIEHLHGARDHANPQRRVRELRSSGADFRRDLLASSSVQYYRCVELVRVPYPTRFGFLHAADVATPYMHLCNRLFIVQFRSGAEPKTLLVSPSDPDGNAETPFFRRLGDSFAPFDDFGRRVVSPVSHTVEGALAESGIAPEQVDYITYDHLHTQDLRKWLGSASGAPYFPNARLLVTRREWASANGRLPPQNQWYCPDGLRGIEPERVVAFDSDVMLGENVALVRTPGRTEGNHSIVVHTPEGLMVTSANGVGPDAYAPRESDVPGLSAYARRTGTEVVLNGNTLERGIDQYVSMLLEKAIAGPSRRNPAFPNVVCSSEFDSYWLFPGLEPTFRFGDLEFGTPVGP